MKKKSTFQKLLSALLCLVMVASYLPAGILPAVAEGIDPNAVTKVADPSTMNDWIPIFGNGTGNIQTENAGGIWTDKSVFADASAFSHVTQDSDGNQVAITQDSENSFLVALSAIASNMTITGQSSVPTDTMLVLDVSGSMNDNQGNNDVAEELAEAANSTIHALLDANPNNRVGVVLYSGPDTISGSASSTDAVLLLPLGRYTTGSDNNYVTYSVTGNRETTETIRPDSDVRVEGTTTRPSSTSKEVVGATYIQKGVILAMNQFTAESNETTLDGVTRKPILVLMSDGAPTVTDTDFTNPGAYDLGTGASSSTNAAQGFVTQLSCAYAKAKIQEKYQTDALFYTLGLGITGNQVATSVLDPANSNSGINQFWTRYNNASVGGTVTVQGSGRDAERVTKIETALEQEYVDKYFEVDGSTTDLAQGLKDAFEQIVGDIQLQSKYYPTLVGSNDELSGYVSFVDKIGPYMNVTDVKGILIHGTLFSGACLAKNFVTGGGDLGTTDNPTALGDEMVWAVQARLGIEDVDTARTLIGLAYTYGQLSYTDYNNFSNYIGWYANAAGEFLGFYHEGITVLPEATGDAATDPAYTVKSYGYLGETDPAHGVAKSDMMYATVQIRHSITTGEELVTFAIPAALLPVITYNVTLGENGELTGLTQEGAQAPIRLVYEVALDSRINELNIGEIVSDQYRNVTATDGTKPNVNADGSINFYTNKYDVDNQTGYGTDNTYAYFNPSRQNDKYYYLENAPVYVDNQGTLYTGATAPSDYSGTLYRSYKVYEKIGSTLNTRTVYRSLSAAARATAVQATGENTWYIPQGNIHVNLDGYIIEKVQNPTDTLTWSNQPFVDTHNHTVNDTGYNFIVGATMGNNGKLTVTPATGIKLTKAMAAGVTAPDTAFTFTIENLTSTSDSGTYAAVLEAADGTQTDTSVAFSGGKATVALKAGQTLYITGMVSGTQYRITEAEGDYVVESVNGDTTLKTATVTVTAGQLAQADFVNTESGTGNLMITKEVSHAQAGHTVPDSILNQEFALTINVGTALAGQTFNLINGTSTTQVTIPANGKLTAVIKHGQTLELEGLPEGTQISIHEDLTEAQERIYQESVKTRDYSGATQDSDNVVTIYNNANATAIISNIYDPIDTTVDMSVTVNKDFRIEAPLANASFTFKLQEYVNGGWTDIDSGTITYSGDSGIKSITLPNALESITFDEVGDYAYQVIEVIPEGDDRIPGVSYDRTIWTFSVHVTDNGGQLVATVMDDGVPVGSDYEVTFVNTYHTAPVSIDVVKEVTNTADNPETTKTGFRFDAYEANADWSLVDNTPDLSVLSDAVGEARFTATYNEAGTHYFVVKEANGGKAGWSYDATEYRVTVVVTQEADGNMVADMTIVKVTTDGSGAEVTETVTGNTITFSNTYDPADAIVNFDPAVRKELIGRTLKDDEFTFAIFPDGQSSHTSLRNALVIGNNKADGSVDFETGWAFDKIGTYRYDVVEMAGDLGGVTYSTRIYDLVVEVTDDGSGQLSARYYFEDATTQTVTFYNTYDAADTAYTVTGTKSLTGRVLLNDEFTFVLTEVADANGTALAGGKTWETTNTIDGSFSFPAITYTEEGTHYYKVTEKPSSGSSHGIIYDKTSYIVAVTVTDKGSGQLVATATVDGEANKAITYENRYVPAKTTGTLSGDKVLEGKVLGAGAYSFQLYISNAAWENLGELGQPVTNGADGKFQFPEIEYDTAGTYYYLVKEVNGGYTIDGVFYDDTIFRVKVEITDDLLGQLHATTTVFDQYDTPQIGVQFVNVYEITGDAALILSGSKALTGRDPVNGEFTFELYSTDDSFTVSGQPIATDTNENGQYAIRVDYTAENDLGKTYYYVLREKNAGQTIDGVTYATTEYKITVKVEDDGIGGLTLTVTTDAQQSTENKVTTVTGLNFQNTYTPGIADLPLQILVEKTVKNTGSQKIGPEGFTFVLEETADSKIEATTDTNGKAVFNLTVAEELAGGTYTLKLYEKNEGKQNVTYSTAVYEYVIKVSLSDDNKLVADVTCNGQAADSSKLVAAFENVYDYTPPQTPVTGDSMNLVLWFSLLGISALVLAAAVIFRKKLFA